MPKYIHPSTHLINTYRASTNSEACVKHSDKEIKKQQLGNSVEAEQETDRSPMTPSARNAGQSPSGAFRIPGSRGCLRARGGAGHPDLSTICLETHSVPIPTCAS